MREKFLIEEDLQINDLRVTSRKVDVLSCVCGGCTLKTIANLLGISLNTVGSRPVFFLILLFYKEQFCNKSSKIIISMIKSSFTFF